MRFINTEQESYKPNKWLTFDDVLLNPQFSFLESRNDPRIDIRPKLGPLKLQVPIISANMDTITGVDMALAMHNAGGLGILHRFHGTEAAYRAEIDKLAQTEPEIIAFSVGCGEEWLQFISSISFNYATTKNKLVVCVDVAHGHMQKAIEMVMKIRNRFSDIFIIAGNVATRVGARALVQAGADAIKVGIGPGSLCTTRVVTGHGVPQLSAIMQVAEELTWHEPYIRLIADGGIRNSGDIVKALAAGADAVMIGGLFAGCTETPGVIRYDETLDAQVKVYRGQSSQQFLDDTGKSGVAPEGEDTVVPVKGPVGKIITNLVGGIKSGLTYSGASTIIELQKKAEFMEISNHAWVEGTPHGK